MIEIGSRASNLRQVDEVIEKVPEILNEKRKVIPFSLFYAFDKKKQSLALKA